MPTQSELMREQAARLLSLSTQAREAGNADLAELLTEAAANCLANIVSAELGETPPPARDSQHSSRPRNNNSKFNRPRKGTRKGS